MPQAEGMGGGALEQAGGLQTQHPRAPREESLRPDALWPCHGAHHVGRERVQVFRILPPHHGVTWRQVFTDGSVVRGGA